jgi:hypothetical protein
MRKKPVKYTAGEIGRVRLVKDLLPSRKKLVARGAKRGAVKTDWKAAAKKPLPSGRDADDAMAEIDWLTTELPAPQGAYDAAPRRRHARLVPRAGQGLSDADQRDPAEVFRAAYEVRGCATRS